jgi:hypothetical protein
MTEIRYKHRVLHGLERGDTAVAFHDHLLARAIYYDWCLVGEVANRTNSFNKTQRILIGEKILHYVGLDFGVRSLEADVPGIEPNAGAELKGFALPAARVQLGVPLYWARIVRLRGLE